ncbi:MAG: hypothetical protein O7D96_02430 [SAR324 cluster bacterium]|nr:hypothetical protein [SAR324 cluster bacterium]
MGNGSGSSGSNERAHERHSINEQKFITLGRRNILVQDISWGGICFFAGEPYHSKQTIHAGDGGIQVEIEVVGCDESPAMAVDPAYPFRVRAQFLAKPDDPGIERLMDFVLD